MASSWLSRESSAPFSLIGMGLASLALACFADRLVDVFNLVYIFPFSVLAFVFIRREWDALQRNGLLAFSFTISTYAVSAYVTSTSAWRQQNWAEVLLHQPFVASLTCSISWLLAQYRPAPAVKYNPEDSKNDSQRTSTRPPPVSRSSTTASSSGADEEDGTLGGETTTGTELSGSMHVHPDTHMIEQDPALDHTVPLFSNGHNSDQDVAHTGLAVGPIVPPPFDPESPDFFKDTIPTVGRNWEPSVQVLFPQDGPRDKHRDW